MADGHLKDHADEHAAGGVDALTPTYTLVTGATYTILAADLLIGVNRAGVVTLTLPTALVAAGRRFVVKDQSGAAAANNITIDTEGAETIDGAATAVINTDYGSLGVYSDGTNWFKV